ncbi:MAG: DUF2939 domain-containing protein, partial [Hyphomicrobiaceae bacterium]
MKKLLALLVLVVVGFYVGWPAWSAYQIHDGLKRSDAALLARKIDFESLRTSLRPAVAAEVEKAIDRAAAGPAGQALGGDLKKELAPKLVETALSRMITPENLGKLYAQGGSLGSFVSREAGKMGGLGQLVPGLGKGLPGASEGGLKLPGGLTIPGGLGRLGRGSQPSETPAKAPAAEPAGDSGKKPSYGFPNIKSFGFAGPLAMRLGVAKDPSASGP